MVYQNSENDNELRNIPIPPQAIYEKVQAIIGNDRPEESIGALEMFLAMHPNFALAHNDLGVLYYGRGEKDKAANHYEQAAKLEPQNAVFQKNLADFYYVEQGRIEEAIGLYLKVLQANPADIEVLLIMGRICVSLDKSDDARVFFNRVLELEPWNNDARERLDEIQRYRRSEDREPISEVGGRRSDVGGQGARDDWMRGGMDGGPEVGGQKSEVRGRMSDLGSCGLESAERMYQNAQDQIRSGRENEGINTLERLLQFYPDFALAHNDLGVLYFQRGGKERALEHYERAAQLEPYHAVFQKNLADFYYVEAGRMGEALEIYVKILETNPTDIETLYILGQICVSLKKPEDARVFFNRVLELEPWNLDARERLGGLDRGQMSDVGGQRSEVGGQRLQDDWMKGWMDEGTDVGGQKADVGGRRSEVREEKIEGRAQWLRDGWMSGEVDGSTEGRSPMSEVGGRRTEGIDQGSVIGDCGADREDIKSAEELYQEAQDLVNKDRKREALGVLEKLVEVYPDHALAHNDLGVLYFHEGAQEKTLEHYEKAAALDPDNTIYQRNLADFYYVILGRTEAALEIYKKVIESNPDDIECLTILGNICVSLKKFIDAEMFFNKVLDIEPWNLDAQGMLDQLSGVQSSEIGGRKTEEAGQKLEFTGRIREDEEWRSVVSGQKIQGDHIETKPEKPLDFTAPAIREVLQPDERSFILSLILSKENSERFIRNPEQEAPAGVFDEFEIVVGEKRKGRNGTDIQTIQHPSKNILYVQTGEGYSQDAFDALSLAAKRFNSIRKTAATRQESGNVSSSNENSSVNLGLAEHFASFLKQLSEVLKTPARDSKIPAQTAEKRDTKEEKKGTLKKKKEPLQNADDSRQSILDRIVHMKDTEGLGWKAIAEAFNSEGLPTFSGKGQWHRKTIYKMYQKRGK